MLETRMTLYCEIRSVLNPSMPLTTGTFNLLSKNKSGHRLSGPFQSNARNPKVDRVSSKLVSFFSRTLQTYRASLLAVNPQLLRRRYFLATSLLYPSQGTCAARDMNPSRTHPLADTAAGPAL